jgi:hypothetical protein
MAYGGLLDILQGILGQQGQGYGQGQDQGSGILGMMAQRQQQVPTNLATDNVYGQGLLGQAGNDRLLGADLGNTGADRLGAPASGLADYSGGQGTDTLGLGGAAAVPAPAATATNTAAPAAQGGGLLSGLFGGGGGTAGGAGLAGLGGWVQKNPAAIDALVTGFANIGNKNVGNPFLYGASQAAPEFKEQKARDELESRQEAMKSAMLKLGYPAELAAAAGKIPELGTTVISQALKPREAKDAPALMQEYQYAVSQGFKGSLFDYQKELRQAGATTVTIPPDREKLSPGYRWVDPNDISKGEVPVTGGPAEQMPAELAARVGLAKDALKKLDTVEQAAKEGVMTGPIDYTTGTVLGRGKAGEMSRELNAGSEALVRMLTGAGMNASEAKREASQYLVQPTDNAETLANKVSQLKRRLQATIVEATRGRGGVNPASQTTGDPAGIR